MYGLGSSGVGPIRFPGGIGMKSSLRTLLTMVAVAALATSCAAPRNSMNDLRPGMSREQVRAILGEPDSSRLRRGEDCMVYSLWRDFWNRRPGNYSDRYYTCFTNGRLTSYGRVGDEF